MGKSATANTISGGDYFKSGACALAMTEICQQQKVTRFDREISIIDTPGIFEGHDNQRAIEEEMTRCIHLGAPGLHAILYVMEVGRFKQEDMKAIETFMSFFGNEMKKRVIVVFTHGDALLKMEQTLSDYLKTVPANLKAFLEICEDRVILVNNNLNKEQSEEQVLHILLMIETLKITYHSMYRGSNHVFAKAETRIQKREQEIMLNSVQNYKGKTEEFKRRLKIKMQREVMLQERLDELMKVKEYYEKLLNNVREEVRREIKSTKSTW